MLCGIIIIFIYFIARPWIPSVVGPRLEEGAGVEPTIVVTTFKKSHLRLFRVATKLPQIGNIVDSSLQAIGALQHSLARVSAEVGTSGIWPSITTSVTGRGMSAGWTPATRLRWCRSN